MVLNLETKSVCCIMICDVLTLFFGYITLELLIKYFSRKINIFIGNSTFFIFLNKIKTNVMNICCFTIYYVEISSKSEFETRFLYLVYFLSN